MYRLYLLVLQHVTGEKSNCKQHDEDEEGP